VRAHTHAHRYRWTDSGSGKTTRVSSAEYVDFVLSWIDAQMDDPRIFPVSETEPFPADFQSHYAKDMFKRMFRILAIVYSSHIDKIKSLDASAHLNTVFKHFLFFCLCFDLLEEQEMKALKPQCDRLIEEYHKSDV
jgi:MOB kinase activator 1